MKEGGGVYIIPAGGKELRNMQPQLPFKMPYDKKGEKRAGYTISSWMYHCGRKRYIVNSEKYFTCSQHVSFTFIKSPEYHTCIAYMGGGGGALMLLLGVALMLGG